MNDSELKPDQDENFNFHTSMKVGDLRKKYSVHPVTWSKWVSKVPELNLSPGQRIYNRNQVEKIVQHLGLP